MDTPVGSLVHGARGSPRAAWAGSQGLTRVRVRAGALGGQGTGRPVWGLAHRVEAGLEPNVV